MIALPYCDTLGVPRTWYRAAHIDYAICSCRQAIPLARGSIDAEGRSDVAVRCDYCGWSDEVVLSDWAPRNDFAAAGR